MKQTEFTNWKLENWKLEKWILPAQPNCLPTRLEYKLVEVSQQFMPALLVLWDEQKMLHQQAYRFLYYYKSQFLCVRFDSQNGRQNNVVMSYVKLSFKASSSLSSAKKHLLFLLSVQSHLCIWLHFYRFIINY